MRSCGYSPACADSVVWYVEYRTRPQPVGSNVTVSGWRAPPPSGPALLPVTHAFGVSITGCPFMSTPTCAGWTFWMKFQLSTASKSCALIGPEPPFGAGPFWEPSQAARPGSIASASFASYASPSAFPNCDVFQVSAAALYADAGVSMLPLPNPPSPSWICSGNTLSIHSPDQS